MDVLIVGAGTMGRWVADTVDASVAFADVDEEAAVDAADAVGGEVAPLSARADEYDAVCVAVPLSVVTEAITDHASRATGAIVDLAGVMGPALAAMERAPPDLERVSLHPLFAPDRAPGTVAVVRDEPGPVSDRLLADLERAGNDLVETTAEEHDTAMESVQAAAHAAVVAFALAAEPVPEALETPVYASLRELTERITAGTPRVYADIQAAFDGSRAVAEAAARVADADPDELETLLCEAGDRWAGANDGPSSRSWSRGESR